MTDFYKIVDNGYIVGFGTNGSDSVISVAEDEYDALVSMFAERPTAPSGYAYLLQDDPLEWVLVELPPEPEPDIDDAEALDILLGRETT